MTSGMVFDKNSDIDFKSDRFEIQVVGVDDEPGEWVTLKCFGWVTVVTRRDNWVMTTRVEPFAQCNICGYMQGVASHWNAVHGGLQAYRFLS